MNNIFRNINKALTKEEILMLSPLQLAYIGDGVYEVFIRTYLMNRGKNVNEMNKLARKLVNANAQANIVAKLEDFLTEAEKKVIKRGRNTKVNTSPKNMDIMDYKYATGFEALIGKLYLEGQDDRLYEIMEKILYGKLNMLVSGAFIKTDKVDVDFIKDNLPKYLDEENIKFENLLVRQIDEDLEFEEIEVSVEFIVESNLYEREEDEIYDKFIKYMEVHGLDFGGGAVLKLREDNYEG